MDRRTLTPLVFIPLTAYLVLLFVLSTLATHPTMWGWLGLFFLSAVLLSIGAAIVIFFPRGRTNADAVPSHTDGRYRLLVVADTEIEPAELCAAVRKQTRGRRTDVRVIAPVVASTLHFLFDDEGTEHAAAERRLSAVLRSLAADGIDARGAVGTDDPLQATGDGLAGFPADEVLFVASSAAAPTWQERDFAREARQLYRVPVSTVSGAAPAAATPVIGLS